MDFKRHVIEAIYTTYTQLSATVAHRFCCVSRFYLQLTIRSVAGTEQVFMSVVPHVLPVTL